MSRIGSTPKLVSKKRKIPRARGRLGLGGKKPFSTEIKKFVEDQADRKGKKGGQISSSWNFVQARCWKLSCRKVAVTIQQEFS